MLQYSVPLALEDYLTVVFSAIGLILLTRMVLQLDRTLGQMALIGVVLTVVGGVLKATGKLVMAMGGPDIAVMNLGLFPLIAPGFTLVAWSLYHLRRSFRSQPPLPRPWLVPGVLIGIFGAGSLALWLVGGPWRLPLILLGSLANISMLVMLALAAWGRQLRLASVLFVITLVVVVAMAPLPQIKNQTIALVWFEQITQSLAQALFAFGAWQYSQQVLSNNRRLVPQLA
jgi:hypothetical protein